jgi:hypothetical protein
MVTFEKSVAEYLDFPFAGAPACMAETSTLNLKLASS